MKISTSLLAGAALLAGDAIATAQSLPIHPPDPLGGRGKYAKFFGRRQHEPLGQHARNGRDRAAQPEYRVANAARPLWRVGYRWSKRNRSGRRRSLTDMPRWLM
jgi:hypothetical protein